MDTQGVPGKETRRTWDRSDALIERNALYAEMFNSGQHVLDLQCGNGEFLELLSRRGAIGLGLEADEATQAALVERGLLVEDGLPHEYLATHAGEFDGIFAAHLIEHLDSTQFASLIELAVKALRPRGRLVIVSANPHNFANQLDGAWNDLEHVRFYGPDIVRWVARDAGLRIIDVGFNKRFSADPRARHNGQLHSAAPASATHSRMRTRLKQRLGDWLMPASVLERIRATEDVLFSSWPEYYVTGIR